MLLLSIHITSVDVVDGRLDTYTNKPTSEWTILTDR